MITHGSKLSHTQGEIRNSYSFIKLKNLGLTPSEEAMISYGNTALPMGKSLNQMIEAVADATTGEFERLKEFGIKTKSEGDKVSFTFQGITTTVGKNSKEIENYLRGIGDVQFASGIADQADSLKIINSNMMDSFSRLFDAIGDAGLTSALKAMGSAITWVTDKLIFLVKIMGKGIDTGKAFYKSIWEGMKLITFNSGWDEFKQNMSEIKDDVFDLSAFESPKGSLAEFGNDFKSTASQVSENAVQVKKSVDGIGDSIRSSFVDALFESGNQAQSWGDSLKSIFMDVGKSYLNNVLKNFSQSAFPSAGGGGAGGGGMNSLFSSLADSFGGFFAKGGTLQPGQWGIAGENGPEPIFAGNRPMNVTPNGGGESKYYITQNIMTPDVKGFRKSQAQIAAETPNFIKKASKTS